MKSPVKSLSQNLQIRSVATLPVLSRPGTAWNDYAVDFAPCATTPVAKAAASRAGKR